MKFELTEYNYNLPDDELISDLIKTASMLGKEGLTQKEYQANGKYAYTTLMRRFGTWNKALEKANLKKVFIRKGNQYPINSVSDEELIEDIKMVAINFGSKAITTVIYKKYGHYNLDYFRRFGSWEKVLLKAGLQLTEYRKFVSNEELFNELERVWIKLGRQPTTDDMKRGISKYSLSTFMYRFGGWRDALQAFVKYINEENTDDRLSSQKRVDMPEILQQNHDVEELSEKESIQKHRTPRNINLRLRFLIMQRDNFKCCACGASPAKDPAVELHIDHIKPWSKDGESVMENLQTLCSKCNLGKGDLI